MNHRPGLLLSCAAVLGTVASAQAQTLGEFDIRFNLAGASASQQAVFDNSAAFWESVITGYAPGVALDGIEIDVTIEAIDGPGGALAGAGPRGFLNNQAGFAFATANDAGTGLGTTQRGAITVDTADFGNAFLETIINHEVGHALGFGTLFTQNNVYVDGTGRYTGANGLAAYQDEFDSAATFVPIELDGGPGTANGHLAENRTVDEDGNPLTFGFLTGITDPQGRDLANELLTGFLGPNPGATFLSNTTVAILSDLGYSVVLPNVIPEPATALLLFGAGGLLVGRRRRAA